jgi:hypothetical protein
MTAKSAALLLGVVFIIVGILGFIDNPIVGTSPDAIFHADSIHNWVHIVSGVLFVLFASSMPASVSGFMILFGIVYLGLGIYGMMTIGSEGTTKLLGFLTVNGADNYLHIALGAVILLMGFVTRRTVVRA